MIGKQFAIRDYTGKTTFYPIDAQGILEIPENILIPQGFSLIEDPLTIPVYQAPVAPVSLMPVEEIKESGEKMEQKSDRMKIREIERPEVESSESEEASTPEFKVERKSKKIREIERPE